jgi:transposase InsO family protein
MSLRQEFVTLASQPDANIRALCRQYGISPTTGYKWCPPSAGRRDGLADQSRQPHTAPTRTASTMEQAVLAVRAASDLGDAPGTPAALVTPMPSPSTITAILRRHGQLDPTQSPKHRAWQRFEHPAPNSPGDGLHGHFPIGTGRCHPLTVLDDHSRFALAVVACPNEQATTVQTCLTTLFRRYGLPERLLMDNGAPWGDAGDQPYTILTVWLLRLGIRVSHGRPAHPQTQGKEERFHRTLQAEAIQGRTFPDLAACQVQFDHFRTVYNLERPHHALGLATPASRYQPSPRPFPDPLPPIEYGPDDLVRMVQAKGEISVQGRLYQVGKAFRGWPVALRPTGDPALWQVYFCHHAITTLDLRAPAE